MWQRLAIRYDHDFGAAVHAPPFNRAEQRQCGDGILVLSGGCRIDIVAVTHPIIDKSDGPQPPSRLAHQKAGECPAIGAGTQNGSWRAPHARPPEPCVDQVLDPRAEHKCDRANQWHNRQLDRRPLTNQHQHSREHEQQRRRRSQAEALHQTLGARTIEPQQTAHPDQQQQRRRHLHPQPIGEIDLTSGACHVHDHAGHNDGDGASYDVACKKPRGENSASSVPLRRKRPAARLPTKP